MMCKKCNLYCNITFEFPQENTFFKNFNMLLLVVLRRRVLHRRMCVILCGCRCVC